jgi:hypothetical protein
MERWKAASSPGGNLKLARGHIGTPVAECRAPAGSRKGFNGTDYFYMEELCFLLCAFSPSQV